MAKNPTQWFNNDVKNPTQYTAVGKNATTWANNDVKPATLWANGDIKPPTGWQPTSNGVQTFYYDDSNITYDMTNINYDTLVTGNQLNELGLTHWSAA